LHLRQRSGATRPGERWDSIMADEIPFDHDKPTAGALQTLSPLVRRIVAGNAGPFTFTGTCTYVIGHGRVAVLDPGPEDQAHRAALLDALRGETVETIVLTHTHRDHADGVAALKQATGARVVGCTPHRAARALGIGETNLLDSSANRDYAPDHVMANGDRIEGPGFTLEAIATPGHTANHLAFALEAENAIFSGDHVMAWSTSIVAPPDGAMGDYMASLEVIGQRKESIYWPGHGGPVREPQRFVRALITHRRQREASILDSLARGDATIPAIVDRVYKTLAPRLKGAAGLSVFAHLEDLVARGLVASDGPVRLDAHFRLLG
jgi:glyoxylase-like metal-dependent hydrolase (beta-lactamase superfamily II)